MPSLKAVLLAACLATTSSCLPQSGSKAPRVLRREQVAGGHLTWYAIDESETQAEARQLDRRRQNCGSNDVSCSGDHRGDVGTCQALVLAINNDGKGSDTIPPFSQSICIQLGEDACCIGWSEVIQETAVYRDLVSAADAVLASCSSGSGVSGLTRNTQLGSSTCMTQCLSDRPTGCK